MKTLNDLRPWVLRIGRFASINNIEIIEGYLFPEDHSNVVHSIDGMFGTLRFRIYTNENRYSITARCEPHGHTYLGCIASQRKPRAGEDWTRGNDLADGKLSLDTWNKILGDIVSYEMVKVHGPRIEIGDNEPSTIETVSEEQNNA